MVCSNMTQVNYPVRPANSKKKIDVRQLAKTNIDYDCQYCKLSECKLPVILLSSSILLHYGTPFVSHFYMTLSLLFHCDTKRRPLPDLILYVFHPVKGYKPPRSSEVNSQLPTQHRSKISSSVCVSHLLDAVRLSVSVRASDWVNFLAFISREWMYRYFNETDHKYPLYQVHVTLMTLRRSLGQRSRSPGDSFRVLVNSIASGPLKGFKPKHFPSFLFVTRHFAPGVS